MKRMRKSEKPSSGKMGRKSQALDWVEGSGLTLISTWKRNGLTDKEIEQQIGISHTAFSGWKRKYAELQEALKKSKERADAAVESALFSAAVGHVAKLRKEKVLPSGQVVQYIEEEYIKPDIKAVMFYLCNRLPGRYRTYRDGEKQLEKAVSESGGVVNIVVKNDSLRELEEREIQLVEEKERMKETVLEQLDDGQGE